MDIFRWIGGWGFDSLNFLEASTTFIGWVEKSKSYLVQWIPFINMSPSLHEHNRFPRQFAKNQSPSMPRYCWRKFFLFHYISKGTRAKKISEHEYEWQKYWNNNGLAYQYNYMWSNTTHRFISLGANFYSCVWEHQGRLLSTLWITYSPEDWHDMCHLLSRRCSPF